MKALSRRHRSLAVARDDEKTMPLVPSAVLQARRTRNETCDKKYPATSSMSLNPHHAHEASVRTTNMYYVYAWASAPPP